MLVCPPFRPSYIILHKIQRPCRNIWNGISADTVDRVDNTISRICLATKKIKLLVPDLNSEVYQFESAMFVLFNYSSICSKRAVSFNEFEIIS